MGLEEVKQDILEEAKAKADKIVKDAEREAEEIIEDAREEAEKIRERYQDELEEEKESYRQKEISNARMKAKEQRLEAKQEKMEEVFEEFEEELQDLSDSEKEAYVENCLEKVDFEVGKVIGGPGFEDFVDVEFDKRDTSGIIVVSEDGEKRQNFAFDKIVQQYRDQYRKNVAEKLF